ncbi:hypothetical protein BKA00_005642 [Actinomadura coerulea]|uniref:Uncharacterized protein n=1 Tax=Actinomadura coerulea TaxID=46159 RepID=A0A7X0G3E5_9ACTN|nr:hypothetical protein [Actinomadura coerulea]MBB6398728.1 hypothetical protein [Actinomadura coerulea]GGP99738.1 hypothetical protein GCM10010187_14350 [Actinomadura coerulea]
MKSELSAGGRRLGGRFPLPLGFAAVAGQAVALVVWAAHTPGGEPERAAAAKDDGKVAITYIVTGDRPTADVMYAAPSGSEDHEALALPFKAQYRFEEDDLVSLSVQNRYQNGPGTMMCTILANGVVVKQATASGKHAVASCSGSAGGNKPVPGAKIPALTAPGLPKGEVRLTKVVRVPRYKGPGSPVLGRVDDGDARLSYAALGGAWGPSRRSDPEVTGYGRRQVFDTDPSWQAVFASGKVSSELMGAFKGPDKLRALASAVQDDRQYKSFTDTTTGRDVASQPLNVSGRKAWVIVREMRFRKEGVSSTMDLSAVVVVDTGRPRPSFVWLDVPASHKRLWPDINTLLRSLRAG